MAEKEEIYLLEQYLDRQVMHHDLLQFTIFKAFVLAKFALWMFESLDRDFIQTADFQQMFYVKPLTFYKILLMM